MREIKPGTKYRHFKGHIVEVLDIATHTETEEKMVFYKRIDDGTNSKWVRPYDMFASEVDHEKYPGVTQRYRFEELSMYEYTRKAANGCEAAAMEV